MLTLRPDKIFVPSNEDFGVGTWQKPTNFVSHLLARKVSKSKDVSSLMWIVLDEQGKELYFSGLDIQISSLLKIIINK